MISVATWNMDYWKRNKEQRQAAWAYLTVEIRPDIALLQECMPPPDMTKEYNNIYREIGGTRKWGSAVSQPSAFLCCSAPLEVDLGYI